MKLKNELPIQIERFNTGRTKITRRYAIREVLPENALRLAEDIAALKSAIAALRTVLPDNIRKGWGINNLEERTDAEMDLWNEIHLLQKWLRNAERQMRTRYLDDGAR